MDVQKIFTEIYFANRWGDAESRSGPGSSVTRCGDFNWMRLTEMPGLLYIGADVVPDIVRRNENLYAGELRCFVCLNMILDPLPSADLILCRDGLVHLSFADIASALRHMRSSGAKYLLATTFDAHLTNCDIQTGDWRPLNLRLPPLLFPPPVRKIWDGPRPDGKHADKMLALYTVADLPAF